MKSFISYLQSESVLSSLPVFSKNLFNVFFKFRNVTSHQSPQKFSLDLFVRMDHSITSLNYRLCIMQTEIRFSFQYSVYSLTHYLT